MNFSRVLNSKITFLLILLILGYLTFSLIKPFHEKQQVDNQIATLEEEIAQLRAQKQEFEQKKEYFDSDDYLQKEARRLLNYKKPGEEVFAVIPGKEVPQPVDNKEKIKKENLENSVDKNENISNLESWYRYFVKTRQ